MDPFNEIATDYLKDLQVLTAARREFETALDAWWRDLLPGYVLPALNAATDVACETADIRSGMHSRWLRAYPAVRMDILDPRETSHSVYELRLWVTSLPELRRLRKQPEMERRLNETARQQQVGDGELRWAGENTDLARIGVKIQPENPDATARELADTAVRVFRVVLEYGRLIARTDAPAKTE